MHSLINDHLVSTDDGPPSIRGCEVFQLKVFLLDRVWQFQVAKHLRWVGWGVTILTIMPLCGPILQVKTFSKIFNYKLKFSGRAEFVN